MKLEVGKRYKAKNGEVYEIWKTDAPHDEFPVIGFGVKYGNTMTFTKDGTYYTNAPSDDDLISEYHEPVDVEGWAVVDDGGVRVVNRYKHQAENHANTDDRIVKVRITEIREED